MGVDNLIIFGFRGTVRAPGATSYNCALPPWGQELPGRFCCKEKIGQLLYMLNGMNFSSRALGLRNPCARLIVVDPLGIPEEACPVSQ